MLDEERWPVRSVFFALVLFCAAASPVQAGSSSARAFSHVYRVLQHPRCKNCHPVGDRPLHGNDSHPHSFGVQRGADGRGLPDQRCARCHQDRNQPGVHKPPGAPQPARLKLPAGTTRWQLPHPKLPLTFEGRSPAQLCRQLLNAATNGGLSPEALIEHVEHDPLVLWAWDPGSGRTTPPGTHQEFADAVRVWIENGPACPAPECRGNSPRRPAGSGFRDGGLTPKKPRGRTTSRLAGVLRPPALAD